MIDSQHPRFAVVAAAGSGKTRVLVERYLRSVTEGELRPDQILTITFTRKAAAEMKRRIVAKLREAGRWNDAQVAETGPIQTIHGFCERLLRENALAAGIDPEFEILDDGAVREMFEDTLRTWIERPTEELPGAQRLIAELAGTQTYQTRGTLHERLASTLWEVLKGLRGTELNLARLERISVDAATYWAEARAEMLLPFDTDLRAEVELASPAHFAEKLESALRRRRQTVPAFVKSSVKASHHQQASIERTWGLMQLGLSLLENLRSRMDAKQAFDFSELERRAVDLVAARPEVSDRLREQYPVVLVDEAQDVNPIQYRLIGSLKASGEMMVGDPQQSIYGFRMADPALFRERTREVPALRITSNFRSAPGVLRAVDHVFAPLWPEYQPMAPLETSEDDPFGGPKAVPMEGVELWPMPSDAPSTLAERVRDLIADGERPGRVAVLVRFNAFGAAVSDRLNELGIPARVVGGSESFYLRMEVRDLANALEATADPTNDHALLAFLRSPAVGLSLDSVVLLARQKPAIAQLETQGVPPGDQERLERLQNWWPELRREALRMPAWEVLSHLLHASPYLTEVARRPRANAVIANVRKLLMLATEHAELGPIEFAHRIRRIQQIRIKEGDAPANDENEDVVSVMTVHKAKGLEFPVVVLGQTLSSRKGSDEVLYDSDSGLIASSFFGEASVLYRWAADRRKERDAEESLRLLYVGMTRAQERLCLAIAESTTGRDSHGKVLTKAFGYPDGLPEGIRVRGGRTQPEG